MTRHGAMPPTSRAKPATLDFIEDLKRVDQFFQGKDEVHKSMRRLVGRLERAGIPYAVMGGMAVFAHRHERMTKDVDVLLNQAGLDAFQARFVPKQYESVPGRPRRFVDRVNHVVIDVLVTGRFPGMGKPGPIAFPEPASVAETKKRIQFVNLQALIELKLAARRYKDFGDVVDLIRIHGLDETFLPRIHPTVRQDFIECLEEKRREDEYDAQ